MGSLFIKIQNFCIFVFLWFCQSSFSASAEWVHITTRDKIDVFSKINPDSPIRSLRAQGLINGKIEDIIAILRNVEGAKDWIPNLVERSYVDNISDREAILYDVSDLPWPVTDRDMVVHHKIYLADDKKSLILRFKSVDHPAKQSNEKYIRAILLDGSIDFIPKGDKTFVRVTLQVDPMGKIPKFVVNLVQVNMPYQFLMSLNQYASKTILKPPLGIQKIIDQLLR